MVSIYEGFVAFGCPGCKTDPDHICNQLGIATESLDEMDWQRRLWGKSSAGNYDGVAELVNRGHNVNEPDPYGYSALHYASRIGDEKIVRLLLQKKANPNAQTYSGQSTPLHRACYSSHKNVIQILLDYGADINMKDSDGRTALHKVTESQNLECLILVLNNLKDKSIINIEDKKGKTCKDLCKNEEIKNYLINVNM